ncbi:hypothetical protein [Pseudolactococcus insecticola]|uniref:Uncharacterized protein n=1 Tax=Pseudolactococcus insecticola TaxID=2709158 RepID=A0A6A0B6D5_9LACT|nr:hypothetical protein [Lactococcus insecticola]GFH40802.1 hypothetical protein Hs20B_12000 [Lactococcus insecticola]
MLNAEKILDFETSREYRRREKVSVSVLVYYVKRPFIVVTIMNRTHKLEVDTFAFEEDFSIIEKLYDGDLGNFEIARSTIVKNQDHIRRALEYLKVRQLEIEKEGGK